MPTYDQLHIFESGRRAYRLKKHLKDCPFESGLERALWRYGWCGERDNLFSWSDLESRVENFIKGLTEK